jgi:hypothetical protein
MAVSQYLAHAGLRSGFAGLVLAAGLASAQQPTPQVAPPDPEASAPAPAAPPARADRVRLTDLQGTWIAREYVERLRASRAPHATARQAAAIAIRIEPEGRTWPIVITNFQRAVLQTVIDVQPDVKPKSYRLVLAKEDRVGVSSQDVTYIYFRGERDADGKFRILSIAEPTFGKKQFITYVRLNEPLDAFVDRVIVAGAYRDEHGQDYRFTDTGEAILPDRTFDYEVSLDPGNATCELLMSHRERDPEGKERIGFEWRGKELRLYQVRGTKRPYRCESKPFAVLTRS